MFTRILICLVTCFCLISYAQAQDLVITNIELNSANPVAAGAEISYAYEVDNISSTTGAVASRVRFYLSTGTNPATAEFTFAATDFVKALLPGSTSEENVFLEVPVTTTPGTYNILMVADADNEVAEEGPNGESNNMVVRQITVSAPGPDLFAFSALIPANINTGQTFNATATVGNRGTLNAASSVLAVYASANNSFEAGTDVLLGTINLAGIDTNPANRPRPTVSTTTGWPTSINGSAFVLFRVDDAETVNELEEGNNVLARSITINLVRPDLVVSSLNVGNNPVGYGESLRITATVANQGDGPAPGTRLNYWLSSTAVIDNDAVLLGSRNLGGIAVGSSTNAGTTVPIPSSVNPGNYQVLLEVDAFDVADEGNTGEANNITSIGVQVVEPQPDLTVVDLDLQASTTVNGTPAEEEGGFFNATVRIRNSGTGSATNFSVEYWLSSDNSFSDGSDTQLTPNSSGNFLALNSETSVSQRVDLPDNIVSTNTTYYIFARIVGVSNESNTGNNTRSASILIQNKPGGAPLPGGGGPAPGGGGVNAPRLAGPNGTLAQANFKLEAFPNPASHQATLSFGKYGNYQLSVLSMQGQVVHKATVNQHNQYTLNTNSFEQGLYLVRVQHEGGTQTTKLFVR